MKNINLKSKLQILVVDDCELNRDLLSDILSSEYEIITASDGNKAIELLNDKHYNFATVLLDIVMPEVDGFAVLQYMNENELSDSIPVIMISSESSNEQIKKAYTMGAVDYITRPFDFFIIKKRIENTVFIYTKQKKLQSTIKAQLKRSHQNMEMMVMILSNVVEFRDSDSGCHTRNIMHLTEIMLKALLRKTDKYNITEDDFDNIYYASALHDIGKIAVPQEILSKPGKLTKEEFEIIKTHSQAGADIISSMNNSGNKDFVKTAHDICLYHHERYDGNGYPTKISGDKIPISAQVVSIVDVYDALTSDRCYKKAYSHEEAIQMILNGECGCFNPILIDCLKDVHKTMKNFKKKSCH